MKPGMNVVLNSGGPIMVVVAVSDDRALCRWMRGTGTEEAWFATVAVTKDLSRAVESPLV